MTTAVEFLEEQIKDVKYNPLEINGYSNALEKLFEQAKEMEKEQLKEMYLKGTKNDSSATPWYDEEQTLERMNVVGQNGNDGKHY